MENTQNNLAVINNDKLQLSENSREQLSASLIAAERMIRMQHLSNLQNMDIVPLPDEEKRIKPQNKVRLIHIGCLSYDEKEDVGEKLSSVFGAISNYDASAVFILRHDSEDHVDLYMGTSCDDPQILSMVFGTFERALKGNFPGCITEIKSNEDNYQILSDMMEPDEDNYPTIASISTMASKRGEDTGVYLQGIEKLVDGMKGIPFDLVVLASSLSNETISTMRAGYENLYSQMVPFHKINAAMSVTDTESFARTVSDSISNSLSMTTGTNQGTTNTTGVSESSGISREKADAKSKAVTALSLLGSVAAIVTKDPMAMMLAGGMTSGVQTLLGTKPATVNENQSSHTDEAVTQGTSTTEGTTETNTSSESTTSSDAQTTGKSMTYNVENRSVGNILEAIDHHIERLNICEGNGAYQCAAYLIAQDRRTALMGASLYRSLISGGDPLANVSYVNAWQKPQDTKLLCEYIEYMKHPRFALTDSENIPAQITPATLSPSPELPLHFALPRKSLPGLMVTTHFEFARDVISDRAPDPDDIRVGSIYHMGGVENCPVLLSPGELRKHMFVSGAPGSGKSNFCYILLDKLISRNVKFMVIEPAKGEYSSVFGGREDVNVFGTNSLITPLLQINPFEFPKGIHVLEHLDRIIEVFNASWPMYAAMPALLKEALENAYQSCGWNLDSGECMLEKVTFPTFKTLLDTLPGILKKTEYSQEVQGNYIGSLVTRVKSMTNGICGKVFCSGSLDDRILFDQNTIIDISRLGSSETKSLIMGMMIIRLQEYRSCNRHGINEDLQHVTLLEEAHHLLRQTSSAQSMEGSNPQGMSVEILTNAIAEMRTYGEGFIIADQTPSIMAEAIIGNTSTKVIFKLPNIKDRIPVGNAIALTEDQISEIAKFKTGVAVMHQSHWIEPVLCKVDYFSENNFVPLKYTYAAGDSHRLNKARGTAVKLLLSSKKKESPPTVPECGQALSTLLKSNSDGDSILCGVLHDYIDNGNLGIWGNYSQVCSILSKSLNAAPLFKDYSDVALWDKNARHYISGCVQLESGYLTSLLGALIVAERDNSPGLSDFFLMWFGFIKRTENKYKETHGDI